MIVECRRRWSCMSIRAVNAGVVAAYYKSAGTTTQYVIGFVFCSTTDLFTQDSFLLSDCRISDHDRMRPEAGIIARLSMMVRRLTFVPSKHTQSSNIDPPFLILYRELYCRHVYSRLQPDIDDRFRSYENSCELFTPYSMSLDQNSGLSIIL